MLLRTGIEQEVSCPVAKRVLGPPPLRASRATHSAGFTVGGRVQNSLERASLGNDLNCQSYVTNDLLEGNDVTESGLADHRGGNSPAGKPRQNALRGMPEETEKENGKDRGEKTNREESALRFVYE